MPIGHHYFTVNYIKKNMFKNGKQLQAHYQALHQENDIVMSLHIDFTCKCSIIISE